MSTGSGKVTLIFSKICEDWTKEPLLNLIAAWGTNSRMTHCEIAIGQGFDARGMVNVLRIYNDHVGVELISRTGLSTRNSYIEVGCSKAQEERMLAFARSVVGRPFSNAGMFRSILWPRRTTNESFFCAELVAACLQVGGLLSTRVNPGAATPAALHKRYVGWGSCTGNPVVLERARISQQSARVRDGLDAPCSTAETRRMTEQMASSSLMHASAERHPVRVGSMHVVAGRAPEQPSTRDFKITLNSLDMRTAIRASRQQQQLDREQVERELQQRQSAHARSRRLVSQEEWSLLRSR
jgi:hypothetical protein